MSSFIYILVIASLVLAIDCARQPPFRPHHGPARNASLPGPVGSRKVITTPAPRITTPAPRTTTQVTTTTTNATVNRLNNRRPYNIYEGLDFILPMLGNTKPTSTTPRTTTAIAINPIEALRQRAVNRFCVDRTTCVGCPPERGQTCCYKPVNRGPTVRGECRCVTRQSDLNNRCD